MQEELLTAEQTRLKPAKRKPRILLIDDDVDFAALSASYAGSKGLQLDYAASLLDLGRVGAFVDYDLVILDFRLKGMTGLEVADYIQAFFKNKPVILISALPADELPEGLDVAKKQSFSVCEFVSKNQGIDYILQRALTYLPDHLK